MHTEFDEDEDGDEKQLALGEIELGGDNVFNFKDEWQSHILELNLVNRSEILQS